MKVNLHNITNFARRGALKNPARAAKIRRIQADRLREKHDGRAEALIVLLTPGQDLIFGGTLSIASIYHETCQLAKEFKSQAIVCTMPGDPLLLKYTTFDNAPEMFEFTKVLSYFSELKRLLVHIPEYGIGTFLRHLTPDDRRRLENIPQRHFNILLQNPKLLSSLADVATLERLGRVTATTAHARYSTAEMRTRLGVPLHKLSVFNSPEQYERRSYRKKEDLLIVSPDKHPNRRAILRRLQTKFPHLKIQVVRKLSYQDYKRLVARAKWALTFGEGLDGYFLETVLSGGISFAAYNPTYFTEDFRRLRTVYGDFKALELRIAEDIHDLDREPDYTEYQQVEYALCARYYRHDDYVRNLRLFYDGQYTFP